MTEAATELEAMSFTQRLSQGEDYKTLLPDFSGIEPVMENPDFNTQNEILRALNTIYSDLKSKSPDGRLGRFFPLSVGKKTYDTGSHLLADIKTLSTRVMRAKENGSPSHIGNFAGAIVAKLVATMKANGNWTPGHQAAFDKEFPPINNSELQ